MVAPSSVGAPPATTRTGFPQACAAMQKKGVLAIDPSERRPVCDRLLVEAGHALQFIALEGEARRARDGAAVANDLLPELYHLDELRRGVEVERGHEPAIDRLRPLPVALGREFPEPHGLLGEYVHEARDPARGAQEHALEQEVVNAAKERVAVACEIHDVDQASRILGGFLDRHDAALARELLEALGRHVD